MKIIICDYSNNKLCKIYHILHPYLIFRHINGSTTRQKNPNVESNDMKKIMVNAQVTSIISILELSSMVLYAVIIKLNKGTSFFSLIYAMAVYDVMLPYAFLMNTSHNKTRVVSLGWSNVISNIVGNNINTLQKKDDNLTEVTRLDDVPNDDTSKHKKETLKKENKPKKDTKDKIFTITSHGNAEPTNVLKVGAMLHVPFDETPSTSKPAFEVERYNIKPLSVNEFLLQGCHRKSLRRLVLEMNNCGSDEDLYLEYFRCIVAVHDRRECGEVLSAVELEKELSPSRKNDNQAKDSKSKGKGKSAKSSNSVIKALIENDSSNEGDGNTTDRCFNKLQLKGSLKTRNSKRKDILDMIVLMNSSEQIFWDMIEKLIDLEETFI